MTRSFFSRRALPFFVLTLPLTFAGFLAAQASLVTPGLPLAQVATALPVTEQAPAARVILAQGVVRDANGKPVKGATVGVMRMTLEATMLSTPVTTQTDEAGRFTVQAAFSPREVGSILERITPDPEHPALDEIRLPVIVHASGWAVQQRMLHAAFALPLGAPAPSLPANTLTLEEGCSARGQVVDAEGKPVAGAMVRPGWAQINRVGVTTTSEDPESLYVSFDTLGQDSPLLRQVRTTSDAQGNFTLVDLPPGQTRVGLDDPRYAYESALARVSATGGEAADEQTPADKDGDKDEDETQIVAKITARPGVRLRGRVRYPDGKAAVGVLVRGNNGTDHEEAVTQKDGTYLITGLKAGRLTVAAAPPSEEWTITSGPTVQAKAGEETPVIDLTLRHGALLTGTVRESGSKAPVAGVTIMSESPSGLSITATTDAQGRYRLRAQAGDQRFFVNTVPPDYVQSFDTGTTQPITDASRTAPDFTVRQGLALSGIALDDKGQPAVGAVLAVRSNYSQDATAVVDAQGRWTVHGLNPVGANNAPINTVTVKASGPWELRGNGVVNLPNPAQPAPLKLVLSPLVLQNVTMRVVTPQGQPVAGASVRYTLYLDADHRTTMAEDVLTNARGEVTFPRMRPEQEAELSATKSGYTLTQKGSILPEGKGEGKANGLARAHNIVMTPQDAQVSGRVLDAGGQPAPGVRVAALFPNDLRDLPEASVLTDEQGRFALKGLTTGKVTIGAAHGRAFGAATLQTGETAELKLGAEEVVTPPQDVAAAWAQLEGRVQALEGGNDGARGLYPLAAMAARLVRYDAERAQKLMTGAKGKPNEAFLYVAPISLARTDPQNALKWGKIWIPQLADMDGFDLRTDARLRLALLTVAAAPEAARATYEELATVVVPDGQTMQSVRLYAELAALASALQNPDADGWLQALTLALNAQPANQQDYALEDAARLLADGDRVVVRRWVGQLLPPQQLLALRALTEAVAPRDPKAGLDLLGDMQILIARPDFPRPTAPNDGVYRTDPAETLNGTRKSVALALMETDLKAAQGIAELLPPGSPDFARLRFEIAACLAGADDADAMRTVLESAGGGWLHPAGDMAHIASLLSATLPQVSTQGFADARLKLRAHKKRGFGEDEAAVYYAYERIAFAPAESRLLLENEWRRAVAALRQNKGERDDELWRHTSILGNIVRAMLPLSLARTNEMLAELDALNQDKIYPSDTSDLYRQVQMWLLSDEKTRRSFSVENYNDGRDVR